MLFLIKVLVIFLFFGVVGLLILELDGGWDDDWELEFELVVLFFWLGC